MVKIGNWDHHSAYKMFTIIKFKFALFIHSINHLLLTCGYCFTIAMFFKENLQGVCLTNQSKAVLKIRPEMKIKTKTVQLHCTLICYIKMKNVFLSRF